MKRNSYIITAVMVLAILGLTFIIISHTTANKVLAAEYDEYIYCDPTTKTTRHVYGDGTNGTQNSVCTLCGFTCDGLNKTEKVLYEEDLNKCTNDAEINALRAERIVAQDEYSHTIKCRYCNATHSYDHAKIVDESAGKTGTQPTCTENGSGDWICTICGETGNGIIPATGHNWQGGHAYGNTQPTCTNTGLKIYYYCTNCHKYFTNAAAVKETNMDEITIPALGHDLTKVNKVDANCTTSGNKEYYVCSRCEKYFSDSAGNNEITDKTSVIIPAKGHKYTIIPGKDATCKEAGKTIGVKCSVCNEVFIAQTTIPKTTNHTWGEWEVKTKTSEKIVEERICSVCSKTEERTIEITNDHTHNWKEWKITKAATCTEKGSRQRTCSGCTEIETEVIPATEIHTWGEWKITEPTCTTEGKVERECSVCHKIEKIIIPMAKHVHTMKLDENEHWEICLICETEKEGSRGKHEFVDNVCKVCGYKIEEPEKKEEEKEEEKKEEEKKDETVTDKELPNTGKKAIVIGSIAVISLVGLGALKLKKYKGV